MGMKRTPIFGEIIFRKGVIHVRATIFFGTSIKNHRTPRPAAKTMQWRFSDGVAPVQPGHFAKD
jgi:hypothetical protein